MDIRNFGSKLPVVRPFKEKIELYYQDISQPFRSQQGISYNSGQLIFNKEPASLRSSVYYFDAVVSNQNKVTICFDYQVDHASQLRLDFRDSYGRLLFALCSGALGELWVATTGVIASCNQQVSRSKLTWKRLKSGDGQYKFYLQGDFKNRESNYCVLKEDEGLLIHELALSTDATDLARLHIDIDNWQDIKSHHIENFKIGGIAQHLDLPFLGKTIYAFGDSILAGHTYSQSIADLIALKEGMLLEKYAVNGATMMDVGYAGGTVSQQISRAPQKAPDFIFFDGGTNDAEYLANHIDKTIGTVSSSTTIANLDLQSYAGCLEKVISEMKIKWPRSKIIYLSPHKMGSRDLDIQIEMERLRQKIFNKWKIIVADVYGESGLDTGDVEQKNRYTFDRNDVNGLPGINGSGTHPNLLALEEFYFRQVRAAFRRSLLG